MNEKKTLENELSQLYDKKSKGAEIRSRVKWIEEGERNTSYFLGLEKHYKSKNVIRKVAEQTKSVYSDNDILKEICTFYENLYQWKQINNNEINLYLSELEFDEKEKPFCDEIPLHKCEEAVLNQKKNLP